MKVKVALADSFMESFAKLPRGQSRKVLDFVAKFRANPQSSGINYERIKTACQKNYRSVRIDKAYRGIVMAPDEGNVYVLLWVDHHDEAYAWAARTACEVHPQTGVLQLYESSEQAQKEPAGAEVEAPETKAPEKKVKPKKSAFLFDLDEQQLLGVGVPTASIATIQALRTESELEALKPRLPVEAFEALYLYAGDVPWDEIWGEYGAPAGQSVDTSNVAAALEKDTTKRRFRIVEDELELKEMLEAPLERWRVFLHPSQRKLVERNWNGPVRVLGGAGTGKTVVAMHRAVWIVRNVPMEPKERVLFLTYNVNLASDIAQNFKKLARPGELKQIEVVHIDGWVSKFLKARNYPSKIVGDSDLDSIWSLALALKPSDDDLPDSFYKEEWERVILPQRIESRDEYLRASRKGRGVALNRKRRAAIWAVFNEMRSQMHQAGLRTYSDASLDAAGIVESESSMQGYRSIIVDEAQDMGSEALTLIRRLVPRAMNDLFVVGDGHQRIYRRRAAMSQCGIRIVGRSRKLKINYRTTEQIRRFATAILEETPIDDLDGGDDAEKGYRSLYFGEAPEIESYGDRSGEIEGISQRIRALTEGGVIAGECCVVARTRRIRDEFAAGLKRASQEVVLLDRGADNPAVNGVRVATMHRVKGLEFRYMFLVAIDADIVPLKVAVSSTEDPVEARERDLNERALLHVAASRAISGVVVTYSGKPSRYLDAAQNN